ncbi:hypothetical protein Airi02_001190 [Actinoallomurus iriomotensis]|uniref:Uncharacterized protein n=1 Tax=Actinoallomurus iriomotensis TaxID=478107 RepID=A0A9W6RY12_9ACTN|nr:hypothetical protein Airi02_001190 [Actinoallomurus iriomotensis]
MVSPVDVTLARRRTRIIVVDGERYRWVVAPDDEPGLAIVVERADGPGRRMVTWVEHGTVVAPGLVAWAIREALGQGWTPRERGRQVTFRVQDADRAALIRWPPGP